jgi:Ni,Fe-hydrogenase III component G
LIEPLQARTGKQIAERRPGKMILAHGKEKAQCAQYRSETTQVIVDIIRLANLARGKKRTARFRDAAVAVHSEIPAYRPPLVVVKSEKVKASTSKSKPSVVGANTRAMTRLERDVEQLVETEKRGGTPALVMLSERIRAKVVEVAARAIPETERDAALDTLRAQFMDAARAQLAIAKEQGPDAVEDLRADLHGELETLFADAEEPEAAASSFEPVLQFSSAKSKNGLKNVDTGVHAKAPPCVACGGEIHPVRLEFDTELCDLCGPPRIKERPTTFRILDEIAERRAGSPEKQYAQDFTV